jgi:LemA protein
MSPTLIVLIVLVIIVLWVVFTYNRLVTGRNRTQEAWSEIDVELKRRHDLIPNLVETVKGYMGHERQTLENVTSARAAAVSAGSSGDPGKIAAAEGALSQSLRSLFAVAENYPDLKAIAAFTNLQEQLTATEDKVEFSRRFYNGSARDYNIALQRIPASLFAPSMGFKPFAFFEAAAEDREVPKVDFSSGGAASPGAPGTA